MFKYKYLTRDHLEGFDNYKYMAIDTSPLSVYVMHPFWNKVVEFVPKWVAPNILTFGGFLLIVLDFLLLSYYDYSYYASSTRSYNETAENPLNGYVEVVPQSLWYAIGVMLFVAYTLDGIDGKQARRTQTSGPLGELFDHGLDSYTVFFIPACLYSIFGRTDFSISPLRACGDVRETMKHILCECDVLATKRMSLLGNAYPKPEEYRFHPLSGITALIDHFFREIYYVMWNLLLNFYLSHWEKYNTGVLFLPWGYDFGMWTSTAVFLWTGAKGTAWYKRYVFSSYTVANVFEWTIYLTGVATNIPVACCNIYKSYKLRTGKMRSPVEAIRPLWSLLYIFIILTIWVHKSDRLPSYDLRVLFLLMGTVFSNVACRLIVSQMSNQRCEGINSLTYPLFLCTVLSLTLPQYEPAALYCLTALAVVAHAHYGCCVVRQMCDHFRISCFHIKQRTD